MDTPFRKAQTSSHYHAILVKLRAKKRVKPRHPKARKAA